MDDMDFAAVFMEEASELLEELESSLLELEKTPDDVKLVARVFRAMHTIKGSGAMFGFDDIAAFTHHVETVMDKVRDGRVPVSRELIGLVLDSRDHIKSLLLNTYTATEEAAERGNAIVSALEKIVAGETATGAPAGKVGRAVAADSASPPSAPAASAEIETPTSSFSTVLSAPLSAEAQHQEPLSEIKAVSSPAAAKPVQVVSVDDAGTVSADLAEKEQPVVLAPVPTLPKEPAEEVHFCIYFRPRAEFFEEGGEVERLLDGLRGLGEMTVFSCSDSTDGSAKQGEAPFWDILLTTRSEMNAVRDVFIFAESTSSLKIVPIEKDEDGNLPEHRKLGEILVERGDLSPPELERILASQKPLGTLLVEEMVVPENSVKSALAQQKLIQEKRESGHKAQAMESIRVNSDKLDMLVNLVGELVVTQARLSQVTEGASNSVLVESVEEVERLTTELRDCVLNVRMLPIGSTFSRFKRLVRDLSSDLGKEIELVTEGADTELDKSVIDLIGEPLVHLIRNSIDHGIELPEERLAAGKPAKGTITLSAVHSGVNVIISVADDGRGLDPETIRRKAVDRGLVQPDDEMSDEDLFKCIFEPGFTTSTKVSKVSGRGVGMDVVKTVIEGELKGSVDISAEKGRGVVVAIALPLTLAIIDGLLVQAGGTFFVLPLAQVEECVELTRKDVDRFHGRRLFPLRDQLIPYVRLRDFYHLAGERSEIEQMVIVHINRQRLGLVLDDVIGGYQTVIKSLGWVYRNAEGVSGATVLGNGEVALIIDVASVMKCARQEESQRDQKRREVPVH